MARLILIDGNSILNRAFYGIMGTNMLQTEDGTYTNAVYGFLSIMFKIMADLEPEYIGVAFDMKAPTFRHKMYSEYKGTRKGMPDELFAQMPLIKEVLEAMKITIIEKEGYEADDILGTLATKASRKGIDVTILSGDRDTFQLATDKITIRIPRTKAGKTEEEDYDKEKVIEQYGVQPKALIEVKGLMGDKSDNIPGITGIGEKTALGIIKKHKTIDKLYEDIENGNAEEIKGKTRERIIEGKELAFLSRELGTINTKSPIDVEISDLEVKEWDKPRVFDLFTKLRFNKYIDKFSLRGEAKNPFENVEIIDEFDIKELIKEIEKNKEIVYYINTKEDFAKEKIIKKAISSLGIAICDKVYYIKDIDKVKEEIKKVFENSEIAKIGYKLKQDYILFKQIGIELRNFNYDVEIAGYVIDAIKNKYDIETLGLRYLNIELTAYMGNEEKEKQLNLFSTMGNEDGNEKNKTGIYAYAIGTIYSVTKKMMEEQDELELFQNIEMPTAEVLAKMQYTGIGIDKEELIEFGRKLKAEIEEKEENIYQMVGQEFNIKSTKQLGKVLFEDLKLPVQKKNKNGYSTDVEVLEKLREEHPIVNEILDYRQLMKLNSTYVEGMLPYINETTGRIHSYFHQTVTATGRLSSAEPNLQNIPTRFELGKNLRKVFKPKEGTIFVDADYSQIELRVFAHISKDEKMRRAFREGGDIHREVASQVFNKPLEEVTSADRTKAKAVNFGIVYGISDFGLGEQLHISRKEAKEYIDQYLEKYVGIKSFMTNIIEEAKEKGYVSTMFGRRRYLPELKAQNYTVRQFGTRAAINMPIQGTAADIMKMAMIEVNKKIEEKGLKSRIVLQIHDELLLEVPNEELEEATKLLKDSMEHIVKLSVPLIAEVTTADSWYGCK